MVDRTQENISGFTIIEVLVVVSILALISVLTLGSVRWGEVSPTITYQEALSFVLDQQFSVRLNGQPVVVFVSDNALITSGHDFHIDTPNGTKFGLQSTTDLDEPMNRIVIYPNQQDLRAKLSLILSDGSKRQIFP